MAEIPSSLKISGHQYKVNLFDMLEQNGDADFGNTHPATCTINITTRAGSSQQWATLIHEILEVLNVDYVLSLDHDVIARLESGIFQVLEDNFPFWKDQP